MSFLLKKKRVFVFIFLLVSFLPSINFIYAADETPKATPGSIGSIDGATAAAIKVAAPGLAITASYTMLITSVILGITSQFFNMAMDIGVTGISKLIDGNGDVVKSTWLVFRNLANVGLIFIIIFIAIKTILRASGYEGKKLLSSVILVGLLMNFSFFFSALVVDVSNEMALIMFKEIKNEVGQKKDEKLDLGLYYFQRTSIALFLTSVQNPVDKNTKGVFEKTKDGLKQATKALGATTLATGANPLTMPLAVNTAALAFADGYQGGFVNRALNKSLLIAVGFTLGSIANAVLAVVLFMAGSMIIGRIVGIVMLLIISPLAFVGMVLPNTQGMSKKFWDSLVGQSFFLPIFLLFLWVGIRLTNNLQSIFGDSFGSDVANMGFTDLSGIVDFVVPITFQFSIVIGLFVAAISIAKKAADNGGGAVGKISASVSSAVGGAASAGAAFAGRNTIGRGAEAMSKTDWAQRMGTTRIGSLALGGMKGVAKSGFDARESRAFKGVASATGVGGDFKNTFAPTKDGFTGQEKRAADRRVARAENLRDEPTKSEQAEMNRLSNVITESVEKDPQVIALSNAQKVSQVALSEATKKKDTVEMAKIQAGMESNEKMLEARKEEIKGTDAYKKAVVDAAKAGPPKSLYANNLEKPMIPGMGNGGARWIPFNGRSADQAAAKKIRKGESDFDKLLKKINTEKDKSA